MIKPDVGWRGHILALLCLLCGTGMFVFATYIYRSVPEKLVFLDLGGGISLVLVAVGGPAAARAVGQWRKTNKDIYAPKEPSP